VGEFALAADTESPKERAAAAAAALVASGMIVGLGSGSTAAIMVRRLGERVQQEGLKVLAVATSDATASLARSLKIPVYELDDIETLDINLDGADEIDPHFQMIKGRGGALLREKIVATASKHRVTMITADKRVERLGMIMPIPVEVSRIGAKHTERRLQQLAASTTIRRHADGSPYLTDGGNQIVDCKFAAVDDPRSLDKQLQCIAGVLETGLFLDLCDTLIVGSNAGVERIVNQAAHQA
jgi:ribose 5-phosphate isomerase A